MRSNRIDFVMGEARDVSRPSRLVTPNGDPFDVPAGPPVAAADRTTPRGHANLIRSSPRSRK